MEQIIDTTNGSSTEYLGPVPDGSFIDSDHFFPMASPEFLFLRKAVLLPTPHAVAAGLDLLVPYHNHTTCRSIDDGVYEPMDGPHTTVAKLSNYLRGIDPDEYPTERRKALLVLSICEEHLPAFLEELANES